MPAHETRDLSSRWAALLSLVAERGRLGVAEASEALGVSAATIRRDFAALAEERLVNRTHGGVVAASVAYQLPARYRGAGEPDTAKERIAAKLAAMIPHDAVVGFNGGTTTTSVARHLVRRDDVADANKTAALTVVTNALNIATDMVLRPHLRCVCLGGMPRPESYELTGPLAASVMDQLWLTVAVLGVNGFSADGGATCRHEGEAGISALMARRSDRVIIATEGSKIGTTSFARICETRAVHTVVTDDSAPESELARLAHLGVQVVLA